MTPVNPILPAVMVVALAVFAGPEHSSKSIQQEQTAAASAFSSGNVVVVRIGDGVTPLATGSTATACFLDEYTPAGTRVQSLPLPTAAAGTNKALTLGGTATSEGYLSRSADGTTLAMAGYNTSPGTTGINNATAAAINRSVALINTDGDINTSTALTDAADGNNVRGAVTDGSGIWVTGGAGGLRYTTIGSATSTQLSTTVTNLRAVNIFGSQLYVSTSSGSAVRVGTVGTGIPTSSPQTISNLPAYSLTSSSPHQFFMADVSPAVPGLDVLYVADDNATLGGILKYSLVGSSWTLNSRTGAATDEYRGLTGTVSGTNVTIYAVRKGGSTIAGGGELVSLTDNSGYNVAVTASPATLATAGENQAFRGVALAPQLAALPLNLLSFGSALQGKQVAHQWRTESESGVDHFQLERSADGKNFAVIATLPANNTTSSTYSFAESNVLSGTAFYRLKIVDKDGRHTFSSINRVAVQMATEISIYPNPVQQKATIRFPKLTEKAVVSISSINGAVLQRSTVPVGKEELILDLGGLKKGIYILQLNVNGKNKSTRFEKQ